MDYFGILSRFPFITNNGMRYIKFDDAKFLISEILTDNAKELAAITHDKERKSKSNND